MSVHAKIQVTSAGISSVSLEKVSGDSVSWTVGSDRPGDRYRKGIEHWMKRYAVGKDPGVSPKLAPLGRTDFVGSVLNALLSIPFGETRTYGEVARLVGVPKAARAVGRACGRNPILLFIPCHRVITASGKLGGFMGGFTEGLSIKRALLRLERS